MAVNWNNEREKLHRTYNRAQTALNLMRREAKRSGTMASNAKWLAMQRDEFAQSRALPLAAQAYNARINAEASRYEAAYFMLARDLREDGLAQAEAAMAVRDAQQRQPLMTSAETAVLAADTMEQAAFASGQAARDKAPPLPHDIAQPANQGSDMAMGNSYGWRSKHVNELMNPFVPPDVRNAAGSLGRLGATSADDWWASFVKAAGAGVAAAGNEAVKTGQETTADDPAAKAAWTAGGGTMQWLSTLLGADYKKAEKKPPPAAPFPWVPVLVGAGIVGVTVIGLGALLKKKG